MEKILLIGGGGHCRSVIDVIEQEGRFQIAGVIDRSELLGTHVLGYEVIGSDSELAKLSKLYRYALVAVGQIRSASLRIKLFELTKAAGFILPTIISPRAYVSDHATVGSGTVVMHDALVNAGAVVGHNCIINTKALIEHESVIEDHCHIATAAVINGNVRVAEGSFIGSGAVSKESVTIKEHSVIKAGSVVK